MSNKIIVIFGPTSSGKTALSLDVAEYILENHHLQPEIVNADSRQIYRGMTIGTAKVDKNTRKRFPHHCIDVLPPTQQYSAEKYQTDALKVIEAIWSRGHMPIVVGGSGTYVMSLVGHSFLTDPTKKQAGQYTPLMLIPAFGRTSLYRKIEASVDEMFSAGLYAEIKSIITNFHSAPKQVGKTDGYRQFIEYAKQHHKNVFRLNQVDLEKIKHRIKVDTKKYAMHQIGWLKKMKEYHTVNDLEEAKPIIDAFLSL